MIGGVQNIEVLDHLKKHQSERLHQLSHTGKYHCLLGELFTVSCCRIYHTIYRKITNIRRTESQNLNDSHLVLKSSLPNAFEARC